MSVTKFPHGCDADYQQELDAEAERRAHEDGVCNRTICIYCQDECDCWDVHQNLNLDKHTCGCPCHR